MYCPYHGDTKRSASLHAEKEVWNCKGCGQSGTVRELVADRDNWNVDFDKLVKTNGHRRTRSEALPTDAQVAGWASALKSERGALAQFVQRRGLTKKTIENYEIGWRADKLCYTIPIRDLHGNLLNVRYYQLDPPDERRKIWSVAGHGEPRLYPVEEIEANEAIVICEGELDALTLIQAGIPAVTRTGTADTWDMQWNVMFRGKRVFLCHDMDTKGQQANEKMAAALRNEAANVTTVLLPYPIEKKHGKDVTDYFREGHARNDFIKLIQEGRKSTGKRQNQDEEMAGPPTELPVSVMDSFDASLVHRPIALNVTVTGKRVPSYLLPETVQWTCDMSKKDKCVDCVLGIKQGNMLQTINATDPEILGMINVKDADVAKAVYRTSGVKQCPQPTFDYVTHRTVEEVYVRPSIEESANNPDFTHRKILSVGSHDLQSNQTVRMVGTIRPSPFNQTNEFQAWSVERPPSTIDEYKVTAEGVKRMEVFQTTGDPLARCLEIANDLANITLIRGREELHVFMDLIYHSALEFRFGTEARGRGWLDGLVIGDTRTGKSEIAIKLRNHYGLGEVISCESATFAGVVGGLDRIGDGKWIVKWGSIPVNDRRIVTLDEVTGLAPEEISKMSSIRSSGVAELTKIQSERANARTRLIWLSNPRDSANGMSGFTYGVQAITPVIGNPEDIARFDMAMGVFSDEVNPDLINVPIEKDPHTVIPQDAYREMVMWAWTRQPQHIRWGRGAVQAALGAATRMGNAYRQDPPLIQAANARLKIARIAVAMAIRTFSSKDGEHVEVEIRHIKGAVAFLNRLYRNPRFGYSDTSKQRKEDQKLTVANMDEIVSEIMSVRKGGLLRFFRDNSRFNRGQMEVSMNMSREEVQAVFAKLWDLRAISWVGKDWLSLEPTVLEQIRSLKA